MPRCPSCHRRIPESSVCPTDGSPTLSSPVPVDIASAEPPVIPGFSASRQIGRGGFSIVWEAVRAEDGLTVALKVGRTDHPLAIERFRRDAEALDRVRPPHVPRLYKSGQLDDGRPYIAMERLAGTTLAARLDALPGIPDPVWSAKIAGAVLVALEAVHAQGMLHRDLKPENIFLAEDEGSATLIDFGLTKAALDVGGEGVTRTGALVGTPEYISPEQLRGDRALDARADIYSFGVILFELLTLRLPFVGDRSEIEHGHRALRPPRPGELSRVPEELEELALACLAKEPGRRPPNVASLRRALAAACVSAVNAPARASSPGSARGAKLLAEGHQPVVVLAVDAGSAALPVMAIVTARKGFVARQRGGLLVCVFSGVDTDAPVQMAIATARELLDRFGARSALHLAKLLVRREKRGAPAVYGTPVDRPETWLPAEDWPGVVLTSDLARVCPEEDLAPVPPGSTFFALPQRPIIRTTDRVFEADTPLRGRDDVMAALASSASASFEGRCPGLFTLLGDHGTGKSRLAREAAALVQRTRIDALVISLRAEQPLAGGVGPTARDLLAWALGAQGLAAPADPRLFCKQRLGEEIGEDVWPGVALILGWTAPDAGSMAPGAWCSRAMRALAEALRAQAAVGPVAVILDDAHWADDTVLEALEYATLNAEGCPLWVVVTAHPRLVEARRTWGSRAERHDRALLDAIEEQASMTLAAELLLPAEYPPAAVLKRLCDWAGGNPACLVELARTLKRAGIVRQHPSLHTWYVAASELDRLPPSTAWQWLAMRQLDTMQPELAACARLCSVLGAEFSREEAERVQDSIERAGGAGTPLDIGYALSLLLERRILRRGAGDRFLFRSAAFQDAVYKLLDAAHRREIHAHALELWRSKLAHGEEDPHALERLARHAGACGARSEAVLAYLKLGDAARVKHRHVEADQRYTAALMFVDEGDPHRRALALSGRGTVRYRMHRVREALEDIRAARALAGALGDDALSAELLLEEATALDFANEFAESARRVDEARSLVERLSKLHLELRFHCALGRSLFRLGRTTEAGELLGKSADRAKELGDYETRVIALLVLSPLLVAAGRLDEADERFREVLALCAGAEDRLHLGAAYANRAHLWIARSLLDRSMDDLRRAIQLAREVGNPGSECIATHNVAEFLHWIGDEEEALVLVRRVCVLEERLMERPAIESSLLLARIQAMRGELSEAGRLIAWITRTCAPSESEPTTQAFFHMLRLVLQHAGVEHGEHPGAPLPWDEVVSKASGGLFTNELLETLYWRARVALESDRLDEAVMALHQARARFDECPMWRPRFADTIHQLALRRPDVAAPERFDPALLT